MTVLAAVLAAALAAPAAPIDAAPPGAPAKAPATAAAVAIPAQGPEGLRALFERELPSLEKRSFRTATGITGQVEAAAAPGIERSGETSLLTIPLGTGEPLRCTFFPSRVDVGATLWRVAEGARTRTKLIAVQPVDVVAVDGSALVLAMLVYQVEGQSGPLAGLVKVAVFAHHTRSLLCLHDEPGYVASFGRIVKGLVGSLAGGGADERSGAKFRELSVFRIGGVAVGYGERDLYRGEHGAHLSEEYSAQILPRGGGDFIAMDGVSRQQSDRDDLLERATFVDVTNGELAARIALQRGEDGRTFRYDGEKDGKALQGTFTTKAGLSTDLWFARRFASSAPAPKGDVRHEHYSFTANPVAATPIVQRREASGPRRTSMELGPLQVTGELDEHGTFEKAEMPIGPTKLVIERVWSRGAP